MAAARKPLFAKMDTEQKTAAMCTLLCSEIMNRCKKEVWVKEWVGLQP